MDPEVLLSHSQVQEEQKKAAQKTGVKRIRKIADIDGEADATANDERAPKSQKLEDEVEQALMEDQQRAENQAKIVAMPLSREEQEEAEKKAAAEKKEKPKSKKKQQDDKVNPIEELKANAPVYVGTTRYTIKRTPLSKDDYVFKSAAPIDDAKTYAQRQTLVWTDVMSQVNGNKEGDGSTPFRHAFVLESTGTDGATTEHTAFYHNQYFYPALGLKKIEVMWKKPVSAHILHSAYNKFINARDILRKKLSNWPKSNSSMGEVRTAMNDLEYFCESDNKLSEEETPELFKRLDKMQRDGRKSWAMPFFILPEMLASLVVSAVRDNYNEAKRRLAANETGDVKEQPKPKKPVTSLEHVDLTGDAAPAKGFPVPSSTIKFSPLHQPKISRMIVAEMEQSPIDDSARKAFRNNATPYSYAQIIHKLHPNPPGSMEAVVLDMQKMGVLKYCVDVLGVARDKAMLLLAIFANSETECGLRTKADKPIDLAARYAELKTVVPPPPPVPVSSPPPPPPVVVVMAKPAPSPPPQPMDIVYSSSDCEF